MILSLVLLLLSLFIEVDAERLVCYYGSSSASSSASGRCTVDKIDPFICTHIIYGFTELSKEGRIKVVDSRDSRENKNGPIRKFTKLKKLNPKLKTLVAIRGWTQQGNVRYSEMIVDTKRRTKFVKSVVRFIEEYDFDGLDINFDYPTCSNAKVVDQQNYVILLRELKVAFEEHNYILSATVSPNINNSYHIEQISVHLDMINIKCYDYHNADESRTSLNAPLYSSPIHDNTYENTLMNVNYSINYWIESGAPREKINLGVATYGRSFTLEDSAQNGFNSPVSRRGRAGRYSNEKGFLGYNEICESIKNDQHSWTIVRDTNYREPYAYNDEKQWICYDDRDSFREKARYAKLSSLGGVMVYSIETDDYQGNCHEETYPLIRTIEVELRITTTVTYHETSEQQHVIVQPLETNRRLKETIRIEEARPKKSVIREQETVRIEESRPYKSNRIEESRSRKSSRIDDSGSSSKKIIRIIEVPDESSEQDIRRDCPCRPKSSCNSYRSSSYGSRSPPTRSYSKSSSPSYGNQKMSCRSSRSNNYVRSPSSSSGYYQSSQKRSSSSSSEYKPCPCRQTNNSKSDSSSSSSNEKCPCNKKSSPSQTTTRYTYTERECPCKSANKQQEVVIRPARSSECSCNNKQPTINNSYNQVKPSCNCSSCNCKTQQQQYHKETSHTHSKSSCQKCNQISSRQQSINIRPSKQFTCTREGMFADPHKCTCYHVCAYDRNRSTYNDHKFDCSPGTGYSEKLKTCDHIANVASCRNK